MWKIVLGFSCLGFRLFWPLTVGKGAGGSGPRICGLAEIAAAAGVFLVACLAAVLRWQLFVPQFGYVALLRLSFIGQFYAMLLPGQLAGEAVKAYRIAKGQAEKTKLVASVVIDRVVGTLALLLLGAIGLWLTPHAISPAPHTPR